MLGACQRWDAQQRLDGDIDFYRSGGEWVTLSDNERMAAMLAADDDPEGFLALLGSPEITGPLPQHF